jgi:hypothetical protein
VDPEIQDVSPDSSPEPTEPEASSQATEQPANQAPEPPFHQHPRFREITTQNRQLKEQLAQVVARQQQMHQQMQRQQNPDAPMSAEDRVKYAEAAKVLRTVLQQDPELARLLQLAQRAPQLDQSIQGMTLLQQQAAQAHNNTARSTIKDLCVAEKLPTDEKSLKRIVGLVALEAAQMEDGDARYKSGDLSVLEEAFENLKPLLASLRKPAEDNLVNTKQKTRNLPQRSVAGGPAGQPAIGKPERGNERAYEGKLAELAKKMLEG